MSMKTSISLILTTILTNVLGNLPFLKYIESEDKIRLLVCTGSYKIFVSSMWLMGCTPYPTTFHDLQLKDNKIVDKDKFSRN